MSSTLYCLVLERLGDSCLESGAGVMFREFKYLRFSFFSADSSPSLARIGSDSAIFVVINGSDCGR